MIVVDASVSVKWFVREPEHPTAIEVIQSGEKLIAPDLLVPEVMNVLRRKQRQGLLSSRQLSEAAETISDSFYRLLPAADLVVTATSLSEWLDHSIYDCFSLACAKLNGCSLVTADDVFAEKIVSRGSDTSVIKLSDWEAVAQTNPSWPDATVLSAVLDLYQQFEKTVNSVGEKAARPLGSADKFKMTNTGDLAPAFGSPSYVRLTRSVANLSRLDRAKLLALVWLGQAGAQEKWPDVLARAEAYLAEDASEPVAYLISKTSLVEKGIERLRVQGLDQPLVSPQNDQV